MRILTCILLQHVLVDENKFPADALQLLSYR